MAGYWLKYGNAALNRNGFAVGDSGSPVDPYNPLGLPAYTIRLKYSDGVTPSFSKGSAIQISSSPNVWDLTYSNASWAYLLNRHTSLVEVLGANSTGVTGMSSMFYRCENLGSVALFDTRSVQYIDQMFYGCENITSVPLFDTSLCISFNQLFYNCMSLTSIPQFNTSSVRGMTEAFSGCYQITELPLFNTSSVTKMDRMCFGCSRLTVIPLLDTSSAEDVWQMFSGCVKVESGALALYQQMSTQTTPPADHGDCFTNAGSQTVTGAQELAQIPTSWGGTMQ